MKKITKDCTIEDLVNDYPFTVKYLMENGIRCLVCGEPIWGTLEQAAIDKGFSHERIEIFVDELNKLLENN